MGEFALLVLVSMLGSGFTMWLGYRWGREDGRSEASGDA